jgi:hypothetical protein
MGFLDFFIEREEKPEVSNVSGTTPPPTIPQSFATGTPNPSFVTSSSPSPSVSADDMAKFNQHFEDLFEKANLPGPDYFEFSKMCQAMGTLTEDVRISAAFNGLQVQGLDKQKLLDSATHYIRIIDEDAAKFNSAIDGKLLGDASAKKNLAQEKLSSIAKKNEMIAQLQNEILKETQESEQLSNEAIELERKATEKVTTYKLVCEARKSSITADIEKIKVYVK